MDPTLQNYKIDQFQWCEGPPWHLINFLKIMHKNHFSLSKVGGEKIPYLIPTIDFIIWIWIHIKTTGFATSNYNNNYFSSVQLRLRTKTERIV